MANFSKDPELQKIQKQKMAEMLQRAQSKPIESSSDHPMVLTDALFSAEVAKHDLMLVDFWAPWCGPCRMVAPVIEELAAEYAGKVAFGKLNVDENPLTSGNFGIMSIPTLMVFKNGKPVEKIIGFCEKSRLESAFKPYMKKTAK